MKVDLSSAAISKRLGAVEALRRLCLSLARSGAGREVIRGNPKSKSLRRTAEARGR